MATTVKHFNCNSPLNSRVVLYHKQAGETESLEYKQLYNSHLKNITLKLPIMA